MLTNNRFAKRNKMQCRFGLLALACLLITSGCAIQQTAIPLAPDLEIKTLHVQEFPDQRSIDKLKPVLEDFFDQRNISYRYYGVKPPVGAEYYMTTEAEWTWDMKTYLSLFRVFVHSTSREVLATGEYNAKSGGLNLQKFESDEKKVQGVLSSIFNNQRVSSND